MRSVEAAQVRSRGAGRPTERGGPLPAPHLPLLPPPHSPSSWTNKLITAKDHASVQINVGHLNADGVYTGAFTTLALAGNVRAWGAADTAVDLLWKKAQAGRAE